MLCFGLTYFRWFAILENVKALLSTKMRAVFMFLLQEPTEAGIKLAQIQLMIEMFFGRNTCRSFPALAWMSIGQPLLERWWGFMLGPQIHTTCVKASVFYA